MVGADNGRVDHLNGLRRDATVGKRFEQQVPEPRPAPSQKLPIDRVPFARFPGQIAPRCACPRDPEDAVQCAPVIGRRATTQWTASNNERLEKLPFRIDHQATNQNRLLSIGSLESHHRAAVNPFVNRTQFVAGYLFDLRRLGAAPNDPSAHAPPSDGRSAACLPYPHRGRAGS